MSKIRNLWYKIKNYPEHLRFKYTPAIVDWLVDKSTWSAQRWIRKNGSVRILVDNPVFFHGVTHESGWISTGESDWGNQKINTGYLARVPVHYPCPGNREYENICMLPGLVHLARIGLIELYTSAELKNEQFRHPSGRYRGYGYFDYSLFSGLEIKSVDGSIYPDLGPSYMNFPDPAEQQRSRIEQYRCDERFDRLVRCLGKNNSQDAWHIYTAEKNDMFCFLTMDFKLIRNFQAQSRSEAIRSLSTKVMAPLELGELIGLRKIHPHLFSYHNASFFVRSDLHMPEGKRRKLSDYRKNE